MKLDILNKFKVEVPKQDGTTDVFEGTLRQLTKKEQKELEKSFKQHTDLAKKAVKEQRQLNKLASKMDRAEKSGNLEGFDKLEKEFDKLEASIVDCQEKLEKGDLIEKAIKFKLELALDDECKKPILELCETYGYKIVSDTIDKDIAEGKSKN